MLEKNSVALPTNGKPLCAFEGYPVSKGEGSVSQFLSVAEFRTFFFEGPLLLHTFRNWPNSGPSSGNTWVLFDKTPPSTQATFPSNLQEIPSPAWGGKFDFQTFSNIFKHFDLNPE